MGPVVNHFFVQLMISCIRSTMSHPSTKTFFISVAAATTTWRHNEKNESKKEVLSFPRALVQYPRTPSPLQVENMFFATQEARVSLRGERRRHSCFIFIVLVVPCVAPGCVPFVAIVRFDVFLLFYPTILILLILANILLPILLWNR